MSPERPHRLLFVCSGNLCRSPMAAGFAGAIAHLRGIPVEIDSAGTLNLVGQAPPPNAIAVMRQRGISIAEHRSKGLTPPHIDWADHVLVMTLQHASAAHALDPTAGAKVKLLGPFGGKRPEIEDPMGRWRFVYRRVRDQIEGAVDGLLTRLTEDG
ncbi:MAG: low molecular weight protein arginine phosphatase [Deltaproteobacteria bacterium]|nr:MAG: low molecular weight protein arginine phosphatase [Deltaproteobacteria bacterium]